MGTLIYSFVSIASRVHSGRTSLSGMQRLAELVHGYGIPVTWLVTPTSASLAAKELTHWHEKFGDEVALAPPELSLTPADDKPPYSERRDRLVRLRRELCEVLPWTKCTVFSGHTDPEVAKLGLEIGFEGVWGYCWEQIDVDGITDRGCPWGCYYINPEDRRRPAWGKSIVSFEWTARDLIKAFHSGHSSLWSTDPNDVARSRLCAWDQIDYWKGLADNYVRNARYNPHVFLVQQQESHEMEIGPGWRCYTEEDIQESLVMLDAFLYYIKPHIVAMTLPDIAHLYRNHYHATPSSYMLWHDTPAPRPLDEYNWNHCVGPWPKTFLFFDREVQLVFVDGRVQPICIRNYQRPWQYGEYYAEPNIPRPYLVRDTRYHWRREIEIRVESPTDLPYGLVLWEDFSLYQIGTAPGLVEGKIIPHELLFLRYNLKQGENLLFVELVGK